MSCKQSWRSSQFGEVFADAGTAHAMMAERGSRHLDVVQDNGKIRRFFSEVAGYEAW
jgi:hypothetical protein